MNTSLRRESTSFHPGAFEWPSQLAASPRGKETSKGPEGGFRWEKRKWLAPKSTDRKKVVGFPTEKDEEPKKVKSFFY